MTTENLHTAAKPLFDDFIARIEKAGFTVYLNSTYRSFKEQSALKKQNPKNATPGFSFHNYGMAIDISISKGKEVWKKATPIADWEETGVPAIARQLNLRWGGDFKDYSDPAHFDMGKFYNISALHSMAINQFGTMVDSINGNKVVLNQ